MLITSPTIKELSTALHDAQAEMPAIQMDSVNPFYKSKYATLGAIIQGSRAVLAKHGLSISQFPESNLGEIGITTILMHTSGEWLEDTVMISTGDSAKNPAQEAGITISYLRRYAWASILGIYTEEDTDGEGISEKAGKNWAKAQMEAVMGTHQFGSEFEARGAMNHSKELKPGITGAPSLLFWVQVYKEARITEKLTPEKAAEKADFEYIAEKNRKAQDSAGG